jgi:hypothetical protein
VSNKVAGTKEQNFQLFYFPDQRLNQRCFSDYVSFDLTVIGPTQDPEESILSPLCVPGVSDQPVLCSVFFSSSDNFDCMASKSLIRKPLIDTRLVRRKVRVNRESSSDRSIIKDILFDLILRLLLVVHFVVILVLQEVRLIRANIILALHFANCTRQRTRKLPPRPALRTPSQSFTQFVRHRVPANLTQRPDPLD